MRSRIELFCQPHSFVRIPGAQMVSHRGCDKYWCPSEQHTYSSRPALHTPSLRATSITFALSFMITVCLLSSFSAPAYVITCTSTGRVCALFGQSSRQPNLHPPFPSS